MNYQPVRSTGFVLSISSLWNVLLALHISWIVTKVCIFTQETDIMQLWEIRIVILKAVFKQRNLICIKLYGCVEFKFPYPPPPPPPAVAFGSMDAIKTRFASGRLSSRVIQGIWVFSWWITGEILLTLTPNWSRTANTRGKIKYHRKHRKIE